MTGYDPAATGGRRGVPQDERGYDSWAEREVLDDETPRSPAQAANYPQAPLARSDKLGITLIATGVVLLELQMIDQLAAAARPAADPRDVPSTLPHSSSGLVVSWSPCCCRCSSPGRDRLQMASSAGAGDLRRLGAGRRGHHPDVTRRNRIALGAPSCRVGRASTILPSRSAACVESHAAHGEPHVSDEVQRPSADERPALTDGLSGVWSRVAAIETQLLAFRSTATTAPPQWTTAAAAAGLPSAASPTVAPTVATSSSGDAVIQQAREYLGVPYLWGGTDPSRGLDCSGFTQLVYASQGIDLPRVSSQQATAGTPVASLSEAQPGDLLFFDYSPSQPGIDHVGIYIGDGQMIAAPQPGDVVKMQSAGQPTVIRRVLPADV